MLTSNALLRGRFRRALSLSSAIFLMCSLTLGLENASAQSGGPFASFLGSWSGTGQVASANGGVERIRCRANATGSAGGQSLTLSLVCASDSYHFDAHAFAVVEGRNVEGHWEEGTHQVNGQLTGAIANGRFEGSIAASAFTAAISLNATGRKLAVAITSHGGDVTQVSAALSRE